MVKKCKCGRKAHVCIDGRFYCLECKPNPDRAKRTKDRPNPDPVVVYDVEIKKLNPELEKKNKWWQFWR